MLRYKKNRWIARTDGAILVELTRGKVAIVDPEDWDEIKKYKWCAAVNDRSGDSAISNTGGRRVYMHRVIMGATKGQIVDHIDHDTLDNRRANLRICTPGQSARNRQKNKTKNKRPTTSIYKGVVQKGNKWVAQCMCQGTIHYLGSYDNEDNAARAYNDVARKYHGEFAYLNETIEE